MRACALCKSLRLPSSSGRLSSSPLRYSCGLEATEAPPLTGLSSAMWRLPWRGSIVFFYCSFRCSSRPKLGGQLHPGHGRRRQGPRNFPTPTTDAERLWIVFQNRLIIGLALLEGATFFLLIAYLAEGSFLALVPAWVFIIAMLMQFPTRVGVERWVEEQQQLLQEER